MELTQKDIIHIESILKMKNDDLNITGCSIVKTEDCDILSFKIYLETHCTICEVLNVKNEEEYLRKIVSIVVNEFANFVKVHYGKGILGAICSGNIPDENYNINSIADVIILLIGGEQIHLELYLKHK